MRLRVVVTGVGVVCSAGLDRLAFLETVAAGRSCLVPVSDPRYRPDVRVMAGLISSLPPAPELPPDWPVLDRFVRLALAAADQAVRQSGLAPAALGPRAGAVLGTCSGPTTLIEEFYQAVLDGREDRSAAQAFRLDYGSAVRALARVFGIGGYTGTVTTACSAGLTAIGTGLDLIRAGLCDAVLAGGSDAFNMSTQIGFDGLKAPCDGPSAPFSKPTGLCLGEGAAFLVLERLESAQRRGAPVLAEILGFGTSNDAYHCSSPDPSGTGQSMAVLRALADAGLGRERVGYVNAHGTGTPANDKAETKAIRRVFGEGVMQVPVSSQKAVFGHTLGAAGALETAATLLCREAGVLPPTANFTEAREGCDLDYVAQAGRPWPAEPRGDVWIKESFAFGGHNAGLVLGRPGAANVEGGLARVCISGIGMVTPAGAGLDAFRRLLDGTGPELRDCAPPGHAPFRAAVVPDVLDPALDRRLGLRRLDKAGALGAVAAHLALTHAGITLKPDVAAKVGLYLGHASASNAAEAAFVPELLRHHYALQSVNEFPFVVPNATAGTICRTLGLRGHNAAFCFGEGAGLMSLLTGILAVGNGHTPLLLTGAVDVLTERGWGVPVPRGEVAPAEGAVFFLLEDEEHLRQRGGKALATVEGIAAATGAGGGWGDQPGVEAVRAVALAALQQGGVEPAALGAAGGPAAPALGVTPLEVASRLGLAEAGGPLFELAAGLAGARPSTNPALLGSISSRQGLTASVVVRTVLAKGDA